MTLQALERESGRILIVDDDGLFREVLSENLSEAGFSTVSFGDGPSALRYLSSGDAPDIILLDWKMPEMTGIEVLRHLRDRNVDAPVVFLTVLSDQVYEESGLLSGAVDFIEKSRSFSILLHRLEVILSGKKRPPAALSPPQDIVFFQGPLQLDMESRRAFWRKAKLELTLTEFRIVEYLATRPGRDVRYRELYDIVHGEGFTAGSGEIGYRVNVRAFIKRIRQKFRDVDPTFAQIENYPGHGYRWGEADAA